MPAGFHPLPDVERHLASSAAFPAAPLAAGERVRVVMANATAATGTLTQPYEPSHALRLDIDGGPQDAYLYDQVQRVEHLPATLYADTRAVIADALVNRNRSDLAGRLAELDDDALAECERAMVDLAERKLDRPRGTFDYLRGPGSPFGPRRTTPPTPDQEN